jgi:phthiocerol/phenolphthiocerol synthesis type-I polyketide synthase E
MLNDPHYVPVRGWLADADRFDHGLFRLSARDAELMDPQHRLMLECAWRALEDAGLNPLGNDLTTGVYASDSGSAYLRAMLAQGLSDPQTVDQALHGTEPDFIASLIAYKLNLTGPAVGVRTACSSSLVSLHLAVQGLLSGDCQQALVVAAGIDFPQAGHLHVPGGIQSASGDCRPFDESADGVVGGSGAACVVLRRLADAVADDPSPYGLILGTAINNDGAARAGYYAPSVAGQEAVIRAALHAADVGADSIGYLEMHGTGTRIGDPIEWSAAGSALCDMGARSGQIAIGALKATIGHLDAAAGLASLIKALWVVNKGIVPPLTGFRTLNPLLETDGSPLFIPPAAGPWLGPLPRRAGVSAFGIGGTNAHVIIEQAPEPVVTPRVEDEAVARLIPLSAADPKTLARTAARLGGYLATEAPDLVDVSFTLAAGRAGLPERLAVVARDSAQAAQRLIEGTATVRGKPPADGAAPAVFLFPGQGQHRPGMGIPFAQGLPGFSAVLEECLRAFEPTLADALRGILLNADFPESQARSTELAQPALFVLEYAAAAALRGIGLVPAGVAGHSLGEITAACVAGIFDFADGARFVVARGRAMQACPPGAMMALGCDETTAARWAAAVPVEVEVAALNGPGGCVIAGTPAAVEQFQLALGGRVFAKRLSTDRAFHTSLIEPALPHLARQCEDVELRSPVMTFATTATGQLITPGSSVEPGLFVEQARRPVRFGAALAALAEHLPGAVAVEVGPGRALSAMTGTAGVTAVPLSAGRTADAEELLMAFGTLWALGQPLDLAAWCRGGRRVHLPGYAFGGPILIAAEASPQRAGSSLAGGVGAEDRLALAAQGPGERADHSPAGNDPAVVLARAWTQLLGQAALTGESDFFDLGGDSLLVTQLAGKVSRHFGIEVPPRALLSGRTLARQTEIVLERLGGRATSVNDPQI